MSGRTFIEQVILSLPLWRFAESRVTALITAGEGRQDVERLLADR